jgi:hypothetical protein
MSTLSDDEIMAAWYAYAAEQPGSIDALLRLLRESLNQTLEGQQAAFGVNDRQFLRLRGFASPRPDRFVDDAQRIAQACGLRNPVAFVSQLLVARRLMQAAPTATSGPAYRAAFDARNDLDDDSHE